MQLRVVESEIAKAQLARVKRTSGSSNMKLIRMLLTLLVAAANLVCPRAVLAADTTAEAVPTVVPQDRGADRDLLRDLRGVPDNVKTLIVTFDGTRDKYLQQQQLLLAKMRHATTPQEQDQIRQQLQANRQDFINELKGFREELRSDLQALKGKISHAEFGRIIDAAHSAGDGSGGNHRHRGQ